MIGRQEFWEGKRVEPAYSQVANSIGQGQEEDQKQQTNEAAKEELRIGGIENSIILKHHPLISEWLDTVILAPTGDPNDDDGASVVGSSTAVDNHASSSMLQELNMNECKSLTSRLIEITKILSQISHDHRRVHHKCLQKKLL